MYSTQRKNRIKSYWDLKFKMIFNKELQLIADDLEKLYYFQNEAIDIFTKLKQDYDRIHIKTKSINLI